MLFHLAQGHLYVYYTGKGGGTDEGAARTVYTEFVEDFIMEQECLGISTFPHDHSHTSSAEVK